MPVNLTIAIKQNVRFQGGVCTGKIQLYQIKNGRLVAIIDLNMRDIWKTVPVSSTITLKQNRLHCKHAVVIASNADVIMIYITSHSWTD